jgi:integrase
MASIRKKDRSPFWFACYYTDDGTRTQTSTKTADRKIAQRIADELEEAHTRKATEGQMRRILSDLNVRLAGKPLATATLREYATEWLKQKELEVEHVSYLAYKTGIESFVASVPAKQHLQLEYVTVADCASWLKACAQRASARTANNKLKQLRVMFQSAVRAELVKTNPAALVQVLKTEESVRRPFSMPEMKRLLTVANHEWQGMILAGLYTGQRLKDIATLSWANVDLAEKTLRLTTSKTSRPMDIPIAKPLLAFLLACEAGDDPNAPLFPAAHALVTKDGDVGRISQGFYDLLVTAKLAKERLGKDEASGVGRKGKRVRSELSFHCLRHTATSLLKNAGVGEAIAQDIVGHDSKEMSKHYSHIDAEAKRAALDKMPDVMATKGGGS